MANMLHIRQASMSRIDQNAFRSIKRPYSRTSTSGRKPSLSCQATSKHPASRRELALSLLSIPLAAGSAKALIPDDDDEELIDIAKSRRKERVATEKSVEKSFVKGGDYKGTDLTRVQNAVNKLAKEGLSLETGDLKSLAKTSSESWIGDLKKAVSDLSSSPTTQKSSSQVGATLDSLGKAFADSDLDKAKESFADAVGALQAWVGDAGLTSQIKGL